MTARVIARFYLQAPTTSESLTGWRLALAWLVMIAASWALVIATCYGVLALWSWLSW